MVFLRVLGKTVERMPDGVPVDQAARPWQRGVQGDTYGEERTTLLGFVWVCGDVFVKRAAPGTYQDSYAIKVHYYPNRIESCKGVLRSN